MRLHQAVALVGGVKSRTASAVTQVHHKLQKSELM